MSRHAVVAIGVLVCAIHAFAGETSSEFLARIRQHMADNLARLPNYTCLETIERQARQAGSRHFAPIDRLRLEVAYVGERELYSWPGAGKFEEKPIEQIVGRDGAIGTGSFALHARALFQTNKPEFSWGGEGEWNGRKTLKFDFHVANEKSEYAIQTGAAPVIVAYRGFIEADAETLTLLRIEVRVDQPPPELMLRSATEAIQYRRRRIGESEFLLPVLAELTLVESTGGERQNVARFEGCRQYAGASTVRFDAVESDARVTQPPLAIQLPAGLTIESGLRESIDATDSARGDQVHAVVSADVKKSGTVMVPKGAVLTGRITRVETRTVRSFVYLGVGFLFHTIEFGGRRGEFSGELEEAGYGQSYPIDRNARPGENLVYVKGQAQRLTSGTRLVLRTK